jgi:hypothetical protein
MRGGPVQSAAKAASQRSTSPGKLQVLLEEGMQLDFDSPQPVRGRSEPPPPETPPLPKAPPVSPSDTPPLSVSPPAATTVVAGSVVAAGFGSDI